MASGYGEDEIMIKFTKDNLAGFIHKPYNEKQLTDKVRDIFSQIEQK
jgi:FixJ family two-component response regulator